MNEEKKLPDSPENKHKEVKPHKKGNFLINYVLALLCIAMLLMLLSYLSQIRGTREQIESLRDEHRDFSVSALQSLEKLQDERETLYVDNQNLTAEKDILKERIDELELRLSELEAGSEALKAKNEELEVSGAQLATDYQEAVQQNSQLTEMVFALEYYDAGEYRNAAAQCWLLENDWAAYGVSERMQAALDELPDFCADYRRVRDRLTARGLLRCNDAGWWEYLENGEWTLPQWLTLELEENPGMSPAANTRS